MNHSPFSKHLRSLVAELALPEGRVVGTDGHDRAAAWVFSKLGELGLRPYLGDSLELPYEAEGNAFSNFAGVISGADQSLPPLVIGAHYDSAIPHPCADDNAAAVAIVLAAAERLTKLELARDVVVAIFDAEEPPYFHGPDMGSVRFVKEQPDPRGFHAALILDLVGHDLTIPKVGALTPSNVRKLCFVQGAESHPKLAEILHLLRPEPGIAMVATLNDYLPDMSDHYAFRTHGVPYLFFSCGRWEHYHQPSDTPEKLNYEKMAALTQSLVALAFELAGADLSEPRPNEDFTVTLEAATLHRSLGPVFWNLLRLPPLKKMSRKELDSVAAYLSEKGL